MKKGMKAQVTIWIIVAIVIVALVILLFYLTPLKTIIIPGSPDIQFQDCVKGKMKTAINLISKQGGSINPELFFSYKGEKVEYLCYTNEYYKTCVMQQPLLKAHIEREILSYIQNDAEKCADDLKQALRNKGWSVSGDWKIAMEILPNHVYSKISGVNAVKGDTGERYDEFKADYKSKLYDLIMIATSILNWEARFGDSDITTYMLYYPNLKVEKFKQDDGSKIYILTDTNTKDRFVFATRSLSWPAGYGFGEINTPTT